MHRDRSTSTFAGISITYHIVLLEVDKEEDKSHLLKVAKVEPELSHGHDEHHHVLASPALQLVGLEVGEAALRVVFKQAADLLLHHHRQGHHDHLLHLLLLHLQQTRSNLDQASLSDQNDHCNALVSFEENLSHLRESSQDTVEPFMEKGRHLRSRMMNDDMVEDGDDAEAGENGSFRFTSASVTPPSPSLV